MAKLGGVDLGYVQVVEPIRINEFNSMRISGDIGAYSQNLLNYTNSWRIEGVLHDPTQSQKEAILNLGNGEVVLIDIDEYSLFGYGKCRTIPRLVLDRTRKKTWAYTIEVDGMPAISTTYLQTDDVFLHDLNYRMNLKVFDPHLSRFAINYSINRLSVDWQFYIDNDKTSVQTAIVELQCGDDINKFKIYAWKNSAWSLVGDWGGADAWDAIKAFSDQDAVSHNFRANKGDRGATLSGIGTISQRIGCKKRILFSVTNLSAQGAGDLSTDYGSDQLLLKMILEHTQPETTRPYARITYIDGSLDYGVA